MGKEISRAVKVLFRNWKLFLPLFVVPVAVAVCVVGASMDTLIILAVLTFLAVWLMALFFARRIRAKEKVKFRDGVYNAMTPLISTLVVFLVMAVQSLPVMLIVIGIDAAIETELFNNAFYGSLFVLFAVLMVGITIFLIPPTVMALIAVSAPGMYPVHALMLTHDVVRGKRAKIIARLLVVVMVAVIAELLVILPIALIAIATGADLTTLGIFVTIIAMSFVTIFAAVFLYDYYCRLIKM